MTPERKKWLLNAAKAMGFEEIEYQDDGGTHWMEVRYGFSEAIWDGDAYWNPAKDGRDLQEMICKLHIDVKWYTEFVRCDHDSLLAGMREEYANHNNDQQQAYAWAAIRVASDIWEAKQ